MVMSRTVEVRPVMEMSRPANPQEADRRERAFLAGKRRRKSTDVQVRQQGETQCPESCMQDPNCGGMRNSAASRSRSFERSRRTTDGLFKGVGCPKKAASTVSGGQNHQTCYLVPTATAILSFTALEGAPLLFTSTMSGSV